MIGKKHVGEFCREDLSLIENYDKAIADTKNMWDCHHRLEIQGDKILSRKDLIIMGLYYNRPASELIFLKTSDHRRLHIKNKKPSFSKIKRIHYNWFKKKRILSEETRRKMSESKKGCKNSMYGKHHTEETKEKLREISRLSSQSGPCV